MTLPQFYEYFNQFGKIKQYYIVEHPKTGKSKGFGFIRYYDQESCDLVLSQTHALDCGYLYIEKFNPLKEKNCSTKDTY